MSAEAPPRAPAPLARIAFGSERPGRPCQVRSGVTLETGEWYVVTTPEGERIGRYAAYELPVLRPCGDRVVGTVVREAQPHELEKAAHLARSEREALDFCRTRAAELSMPMRPVAAFAPLDRDVVFVTFAAEERVDFRELLRDLARFTRRRVELRQIGIRDQAKASGGWGPCGRPLCCATFMARFNSVTIRMAKAQNLPLNPARISGMCGRLMCCLAHEAPDGNAKPRGESAPIPT